MPRPDDPRGFSACLAPAEHWVEHAHDRCVVVYEVHHARPRTVTVHDCALGGEPEVYDTHAFRQTFVPLSAWQASHPGRLTSTEVALDLAAVER